MKKIAYLGMGIMGSGMASNLLKAGYPVTVWNRTPEKCRPLVGKGAKQAQTPAEATAEADIVMYCLANEDAVEAVVFGEDGVLSAAGPGQIAVDMSTVHPETSHREAAAYKIKNVDFIDAPVFGSKDEAQNAGLWIVVGGKRDAVNEIMEILESISASIHYMGDTGSGASMKLVGNMIVAFQLEALGEAMLLAHQSGLDPKDVLGVLRVTDFRSPILSSTGASWIERDFSTSFALKHMLKDANLITRLAQELQSPAPGMAVIRETIQGAVNHGWGEQNASALIKDLEMQANVKVSE